MRLILGFIMMILLLMVGCIQDATYFPILCEKLSTPLQFSIPNCDSMDACEQEVIRSFFPNDFDSLPPKSAQHVHQFIHQLSISWFQVHQLERSLLAIQKNCSDPNVAFPQLQAAQTNALSVMDALDEASISLIGFLSAELEDASFHHFESHPSTPLFSYAQQLRANEAGLMDPNHFSKTATARLAVYQQFFQPIIQDSTITGISHPTMIDRAHDFWPALIARASPLSRFEPILKAVSGALDSLYVESKSARLNALLSTLDPPHLVAAFEDFAGPNHSVASYFSSLVYEGVSAREKTNLQIEEKIVVLLKFKNFFENRLTQPIFSETPRVAALTPIMDFNESLEIEQLIADTREWIIYAQELDQNQFNAFLGNSSISDYDQKITQALMDGNSLEKKWQFFDITRPKRIANACDETLNHDEKIISTAPFSVEKTDFDYWKKEWEKTRLFSACDHALQQWDIINSSFASEKWWNETLSESFLDCEKNTQQYIELLLDSKTPLDPSVVNLFFENKMLDVNRLRSCRSVVHELSTQYWNQPEMDSTRQQYARFVQAKTIYHSFVQSNFIAKDVLLENNGAHLQQLIENWVKDPTLNLFDDAWENDLNRATAQYVEKVNEGWGAFFDWNRGTVKKTDQNLSWLVELSFDWLYEGQFTHRVPITAQTITSPFFDIKVQDARQFLFSFEFLEKGIIRVDYFLDSNGPITQQLTDINKKILPVVLLSALDVNKSEFERAKKTVNELDEKSRDVNELLDVLTRNWQGITLNTLLESQYVPPFTPADLATWRRQNNLSLSTAQQAKLNLLRKQIQDDNAKGAMVTFHLVEKTISNALTEKSQLLLQVQSAKTSAEQDENQFLEKLSQAASTVSFNARADALSAQANQAHEKGFLFQTIWYASQSLAARQTASLDNVSIPVAVLPLVLLMIVAYWWNNKKEKGKKTKKGLEEKNV